MRVLLGFGATNRAIAEHFSPCFVFDDSFKQESKDTMGNRFFPSAQLPEVLRDLKDAKEISQIIVSPGIPPYNAMVQNALEFVEQNPHWEFLSEYDFFAKLMPPSVWISGTNGKTTTTQMLTHLLAEFGAQSGGNIGTPLARLNPRASLWILETSSFALYYTRLARPKLYILLPITQDHISWHGSFEDYITDKLKPLLLLRDKEIAILPKALSTHALCQKSHAKLIFYDNAQELAQIFSLDLKRLHFKEPFLLDAVLALCACVILFARRDYELLNRFKIGAHKIEEFKDSAGYLWVDDSKGTNLDATIQALQCYRDREILLILGGDDKGVDLSPLFSVIAHLNVEIFAIGKNTEKLCALAKEILKPCRACYTLEKAVNSMKETLQHRQKESTVALLSPAAASLDQFSSYKERGEKFKAYVLES